MRERESEARHGPYSLMFSPKGVSVLSFAIHLCSAAFLCLSDQHAFISSPVMNNEVMGCVWKCSTSLVLDVPMYRCMDKYRGVHGCGTVTNA